MNRPSTPVLATSLLAAAGTFAHANAQAVQSGQEPRGTRLPSPNVIRVLPSTTTSSSQQGVRIVNGQPVRITRNAQTSDPAVPQAITSADRQQRIAAARAGSSPRGAVASSQPARRIVITSANASPVLREATRANTPQRAPQPSASLAQGIAQPQPTDRTSAAPKLERGGVRVRPGAASPNARPSRPAASATVRPQSMQSVPPQERQITMSSYQVQSSQERKNSSMDMAARRTITRISAAATPVPVATIRVVHANVNAE